MATINRKLQLRDVQGNLVFPRASLDNIQRTKDDGRDAMIVTLDAEGKIDTAMLPDEAVSVCMLLTIAVAAPTGASVGDKYYNVTQNKVYTYSGSSWGDAETPDPNKLYLTKDDNNIYRYDGSSTMVDVSTHFTVLQSVANDPIDASSTGVPSEHAVSVALQKKQDKLSGVSPIAINGAGEVSLQYSSGLTVQNGNLTVPQSYIVGTVDDLMLRDVSASSPATALVDGGTVYTILGNYTVTDTISTEVTEDTKVVTEKAVRDAINAYVATGGSSVTAGKAINVDGGSINVTASTVAEVLGSTIVTGTTVAYEIAPVEQNDLSALTPNNLRSAMSLGQAVDVTCPPTLYKGGGTGTAKAYSIPDDPTSELVNIDNDNMIGTLVFSGTASQATSDPLGSPWMGIGWTATVFPKFADGLKYLVLADLESVSLSSNANGRYSIGGSSSTRLIKGGWTNPSEGGRIAVLSSNSNFSFSFRTDANVTYSITLKNFRVYEVTALTDDAIVYLASLPGPDLFFRDTNAHNIKNKYLVKQDMVCPFIPTIVMPNDSDLTIGAGLAYKLQITGGTHYISVDTIPTNGYGWDAHLQLFVKDTSSVVFKSPLNLLDPLTPNAGQNLTVKFRNGQANVYVDDIDVGYVVTVNGGTENGSLFYGINNTTNEYIVFSNSLDGSVVTLEGTTIGRAVNIVGNGNDKTIVQSDDIGFFGSTISTVSLTNLTITGSTLTGLKPGSDIYDSLVLNNVVIDNCTDGYSNKVIMANAIIGSTVSNCRFFMSNQWGIVLRSNAIMSDSLITGNTTSTDGSQRVVFVIDATNVSIQNTTISNNKSNGVLNLYGASTTSVTGCTFSNNSGLAGAPIRINQYNGRAPTLIVTDSIIDKSDMTVTASADGTLKATLTFSGVNVLNSTVSGAGNIVFANGSTVYSTITGANRGTFNLAGGTNSVVMTNETLNNLTIKNVYNPGGSSAIVLYGTVVFDNILITGATAKYNIIDAIESSNVTLKGCTVSDQHTTAVATAASILTRNNAVMSISDSTFVSVINAYAGSIISVAGACSVSYFGGLDGSILRLENGLSLTITAKSYGFSCMAVGSYNSARTVFSVGGSVSLIHGGQTVSLTGIGTYINADGTNDFTAPYMVVNTSSSGSGSLLYGLVGSTKYVVVSHSVTSTTATLTSDVGRDMNICTGDGRVIVGGTISIPNGSTVSVNTTVDEYGGGVASDSTVSIAGGTPTFSGKNIIGGTLLLGENATLANGTEIIGVGSGSEIKSDSWRTNFITHQNGEINVTNAHLTNIRFDNLTSPHAVTVNLTGCTVDLLYDNTGSSHIVNFVDTLNANLSGCTITGKNYNSQFTRGDGKTVTFTNCKFTYGSIIASNTTWVATGTTFTDMYWTYYAATNGYLVLNNCTYIKGYLAIQSGSYTNQKVIIKNLFKTTSYMANISNGNTTEITYIIAGSTINMQGNTNNTPIIGCKPNDGLRVGTFGTEYNFNTWTTGGTATIITTTGTTVRVSGEGTYINKDGTTDLTVVS